MVHLLFSFTFESPRWLLQKGEKEKGMRILKKIGKINNKPLALFEEVATSPENEVFCHFPSDFI